MAEFYTVGTPTTCSTR